MCFFFWFSFFCFFWCSKFSFISGCFFFLFGLGQGELGGWVFLLRLRFLLVVVVVGGGGGGGRFFRFAFS